MIRQYRSDGTTPLAGLVFPAPAAAGEQSAATVIWAVNEGEDTEPNVIVVPRTRSLVNPTLWLASGLAPQDQQWVRMRITGFDNTADPTWTGVPNTDWGAYGSYGALEVGDVPAGCKYRYEFAIAPPGDAQELGYLTAPISIGNTYSLPAAPGLTKVMRGYLHGIGDPTHSGCVYSTYDSLGLKASVVPDDQLNLTAGPRVHKGQRLVFMADAQTIDQDDVNADTLAPGEKYMLTVSVGTIRSVTKGAKAIAPLKPAPPAGDEVLGYVAIRYNAGGTEIEETDIERLYPDDRYHGSDGGATDFSIGKGRSLYGSTLRFRVSNQTLPLVDDETNWTWLLSSGLFDSTITDVPPDDNAQPHYKVTCAAGAITEIVDLREFAGERYVMQLGGAAPAAPGAVLDADEVIGYEHLVLDAAIYRVIEPNVTATVGQTILDIQLNGTTIFTDFATEDARPSFAFDAAGADLQIDWPLHQVSEFRMGDVCSLHAVEYPNDGGPDLPPERITATLIFRKP